MDQGYYLISLVIGGLLALIPANIAKKKGYSFGGFWVFGFFLWLVAIIVAACLKDKNEEVEYNGYEYHPPYETSVSPSAPPPYDRPLPEPIRPRITCPYCKNQCAAGQERCSHCGGQL